MAYIWLIMCITIWGSNFVFGKILIDYFSPSTIAMLRLLMIVFFLWTLKKLFYKEKQSIPKGYTVWIILFGICGVFINHWTFYRGLVTADPTAAALILATTPIVASILATIFLKEKFTGKMAIGSLIAMTGVAYVATNGNFANIQIDQGLWWIVGTMVTFAMMIIITRYLGDKVDPFYVTYYGSIVGLIVAIPFGVLQNKAETYMVPDWEIWLLLVVTAIGVHGVATLIWNNYIRYVDAAKASMLTNLEPFVAMVVGLVVLANPITAIEVLGAVCIIIGVLLATYERKMKTS